MIGEVLLEVDDLSVSFRGENGHVRVVDRVGLTISEGEIVGLVGESGSGKSVTAMAVMGLLGEQGRIEPGGSVRLLGRDLVRLPEAEMLRIRGRDIGMIFQEPMTSLNPLMAVGFQIAEPLRKHLGLDAAQARQRAVELLEEVGIPEPGVRIDAYPHQLSGGMRQRVVIAIALACKPRLLMADEPTTALDVTVQAQILDLLRVLRDRSGSGILLITHDLGVVASMADRVVVMYAGEVVEVASTGDLLRQPRHPYTKLLLNCAPRIDTPALRLPIIPGQLPGPADWPRGCRFHTRCPLVVDACRHSSPELATVGPGRMARCFRNDDVAAMPVTNDVLAAALVEQKP